MYLRTVGLDGVSFTFMRLVSPVMLHQLSYKYFQWNDTYGFCPMNIFLNYREYLLRRNIVMGKV
jgi:hypothetical protein